MDITERIKKIIGSLHVELAGKEAENDELRAELAELKKRAEAPLVIKPKKK